MSKYEEIKKAYETSPPKWWFTNEAAEAFDWLLDRVGELQPDNLLKEENMLLRKLLWLSHGHGVALLYGDDGEMQCSRCLIDYKRDPATEIESRRMHAAKLLLESSKKE